MRACSRQCGYACIPARFARETSHGCSVPTDLVCTQFDAVASTCSGSDEHSLLVFVGHARPLVRLLLFFHTRAVPADEARRHALLAQLLRSARSQQVSDAAAQPVAKPNPSCVSSASLRSSAVINEFCQQALLTDCTWCPPCRRAPTGACTAAPPLRAWPRGSSRARRCACSASHLCSRTVAPTLR